MDHVEFIGLARDSIILLFLWGGYKRVWVFGREADYRDLQIAHREKRIKEMEEALERWQAMTLKTVPTLEKVVDMLVDRAPAEQPNRQIDLEAP